MNAGTKNGECMRVVEAVELATADGAGWLDEAQLPFAYRHTDAARAAAWSRGCASGCREGDLAASQQKMDADLALPQEHPAAQPAQLRQRLHQPAGATTPGGSSRAWG